MLFILKLGFMEPDEISVVLQRAAELHTRISDAIERALKSEFLLTTTAANASAGQNPDTDGAPPQIDGEDGNEVSEVNAEAKSLGAIRDALETLEEQLECLQIRLDRPARAGLSLHGALQHQQRVERDSALTELEESRRILLKHLKSHNGKEWEVIHEALAFAGEPVEERDDLPLPPYTNPLPSFTQISNTEQSPPRITSGEEHQTGSFFGIPVNFNFDLRKFGGRLFGPGIGVTSRAAIVVAGILTFLLFSDKGTKGEMKINSIEDAPCPKPSVFQESCPAGKVMILQDGVPKCVVKERIEIPFHGEVNSPDVLFGRG